MKETQVEIKDGVKEIKELDLKLNLINKERAKIVSSLIQSENTADYLLEIATEVKELESQKKSILEKNR